MDIPPINIDSEVDEVLLGNKNLSKESFWRQHERHVKDDVSPGVLLNNKGHSVCILGEALSISRFKNTRDINPRLTSRCCLHLYH